MTRRRRGMLTTNITKHTEDENKHKHKDKRGNIKEYDEVERKTEWRREEDHHTIVVIDRTINIHIPHIYRTRTKVSTILRNLSAITISTNFRVPFVFWTECWSALMERSMGSTREWSLFHDLTKSVTSTTVKKSWPTISAFPIVVKVLAAPFAMQASFSNWWIVMPFERALTKISITLAMTVSRSFPSQSIHRPLGLSFVLLRSIDQHFFNDQLHKHGSVFLHSRPRLCRQLYSQQWMQNFPLSQPQQLR